MAYFALFFTAASLLCGSLQAHDSNEPFYERCFACDGDNNELLYLVDEESVQMVPWDDLRVEKAWSFCFILGLLGTTIGSLMIGATCVGRPQNNDPHVCKAGIGVAIVFGILFIAGATVGIIYGGQQGYADLHNEGIKIRDARRTIQ